MRGLLLGLVALTGMVTGCKSKGERPTWVACSEVVGEGPCCPQVDDVRSWCAPDEQYEASTKDVAVPDLGEFEVHRQACMKGSKVMLAVMWIEEPRPYVMSVASPEDARLGYQGTMSCGLDGRVSEASVRVPGRAYDCVAACFSKSCQTTCGLSLNPFPLKPAKKPSR